MSLTHKRKKPPVISQKRNRLQSGHSTIRQGGVPFCVVFFINIIEIAIENNVRGCRRFLNLRYSKISSKRLSNLRRIHIRVFERVRRCVTVPRLTLNRARFHREYEKFSIIYPLRIERRSQTIQYYDVRLKRSRFDGIILFVFEVCADAC